MIGRSVLAEAFKATPVVGCLACVTQAIQMYGGETEGAVGDALAAVLTGLIEGVCDPRLCLPESAPSRDDDDDE